MPEEDVERLIEERDELRRENDRLREELRRGATDMPPEVVPEDYVPKW